MKLSNKAHTTGNKPFVAPFGDVTAEKTSQLKMLKLKVIDARMILQQAEAAYESYQAKAELFTNLLDQAKTHLNFVTGQENQITDSSQKVVSLGETAVQAIETADDTFADTNQLLTMVQGVVDATLKAATNIMLSAELIMRRKATNPLISSELVSDGGEGGVAGGMMRARRVPGV